MEILVILNLLLGEFCLFANMAMCRWIFIPMETGLISYMIYASIILLHEELVNLFKEEKIGGL